MYVVLINLDQEGQKEFERFFVNNSGNYAYLFLHFKI